MADIDLSTLSYNKTEIDAQNSAEASRVDGELALKSDKSDEGSPSGIATLDPLGKVTVVQIPIATEVETEDNANNTTVISPQRLHYLLDTQYLTEIESDTRYGNLESNGSIEMDVAYNPQNAKDIATVEFVQTIATGSSQTFVVDTIVEMLALIGVNLGDTCHVTNDVASGQADNGTYVANKDDPTLIADWNKLTDTIAWGGIIGTLSDQTDLQATLDLKAALTVTDILDTRTTNIETKTDFITVTQAVDLDTVESDTIANNAKITYDDATLVATHTTDIGTNTTDIGLLDDRVTAVEGNHNLILSATSVAASQEPSALDTPLQVEFGGTQVGADVSISAAGVITFHTTGTYMINFRMQYGRSGSTGASVLLFRALVNGSQFGSTSSAIIDNADISVPWSGTRIVSATATDTLHTEIARDSAGVNFGGIIAVVPTIVGWSTSPCAQLFIYKIN